MEYNNKGAAILTAQSSHIHRGADASKHWQNIYLYLKQKLYEIRQENNRFAHNLISKQKTTLDETSEHNQQPLKKTSKTLAPLLRDFPQLMTSQNFLTTIFFLPDFGKNVRKKKSDRKDFYETLPFLSPSCGGNKNKYCFN